ncbi:hypothetical protein FHW17_003772 [Phyllobacterium sp. P30BS-XVII]|nr:DUF192 domain-containing protein [Phyllobacterium sp. P30BS-XVII]MBA8902865.1 hypothetical protein [Phyllobacterium sp. P30BS-XVII]
MTRSIRLCRSLLIGFFVLAFAVLPVRAADQQPMHLAIDAAPLVINTAKGDVPFQVEVADTDEERERGLMFRTDLKDNSAMLFVFEKSRLVTMWMENTPSALDMIFLDENGRVSAIRENAVPFSRATISSGGAARFVIEVKAGTARRLGVAVGDKVHHPAIEAVCGKCARK